MFDGINAGIPTGTSSVGPGRACYVSFASTKKADLATVLNEVLSSSLLMVFRHSNLSMGDIGSQRYPLGEEGWLDQIGLSQGSGGLLGSCEGIGVSGLFPRGTVCGRRAGG